MFPEHTKESYVAAARLGAGIIECDVSITKDLQLVCRHSQCDLHTTTNILTIPELAAKCSEPFMPAEYHPVTGDLVKPASAKCCTTDLTLEEFLSLCGKIGFQQSGSQDSRRVLGRHARFPDGPLLHLRHPPQPCSKH
jgi:glycerophosphoryl diester phosphodiesterase